MNNQIAESRPVDANTTTAAKSRWDRDERRIGFNLSKLRGSAKLSKLSNIERLMARLGTEASNLNGVKVAAASRWCSTVYTNLTLQQIDAVVVDCRTADNIAALAADAIAYFDRIAGYKHEKPAGRTTQAINTGVFANL